MTSIGWAQIALVLALVFLCAVPLGGYIARVVQGERTVLSPVLGPIERGFYGIAGVDAQRGMGWLSYATALIVLQAVHFLVLYLMLRFQDRLPFNPQNQSALSPQLAFNTAISFVTNANWQAYGGETTMSYGSQMWGLTVHNFLSAATGIAAAVAVSRAFVAGGVKELGNFWVDLTRITLHLLLPVVLVYTVFLIASGVPQTMAGYVDATTLEGAKQTIALGPVAFQEAVKLLGTNGGGFFNANSAHPFENPTALTSVVETWSEIVIPFALAVMFGHIVGDRRQGFALMWTMAILMVAAVVACYAAEGAGNPLLTAAGVDPSMGNMEGKEVRFGTAVSSLFAVTTTATSDGAVIAMHDSFTPLGGMVPMFLIQLGEVVPGGVGSGLYGILVFALLAVFVAGLMVGRTPEYLGKKVQAREIKLAMLAVLILPLCILGGAAICLVLPDGVSSLSNAGPHGLSEMLYAFTSATGNNGSAFAGLTADTALLDYGLGACMLLGRFAFLVPVLAIAGSLAAKPKLPASAGTFPTHGPLFVGLLIGVILILGGLQFLPALSLGPLAEHFSMLAGKTFQGHLIMAQAQSIALFDGAILARAARDAFVKLNPARLIRNPVIFVTEVVSILVTVLAVRNLATGQPAGFALAIAAWLWLTVLFATFAESVAEGRGRARAESLRRARSDTTAKRLLGTDRSQTASVPAPDLRRGDLVLVETGDLIPSDGEIVEGVASVNESAVTGESAPVIREAGGDRSAVTGGTQVVSDWLVVRITADPGSTFIDRMIALVEGAQRRKTPNEIALDILLAGLTVIFLIAVVTLVGLARYSGADLAVPVLAALFVTLIPTTIGGLLSAIGIAGMDRLIRFNVVATSGRAVEAAGDVDTLLLDKTGTITFGNRAAAGFSPVPGVEERTLASSAVLASLGDDTPEGRSILSFARDRYGVAHDTPEGANVVPFTANTRVSGLDAGGRSWRKGAVDSVLALTGAPAPRAFTEAVDRIARSGGTPLAVAVDGRLQGVVELKDIVKPGIRERFAALRQMGIRTVMITGDNKVTAAAIATEAGVDDFLAQATPQDKLDYIRRVQGEGRLVAMCGDGTNDAPALAQADVGVAMQTGTQAAREAGNMVDLDSDPTKLIEVVEIGKQLLITRGSLTTFSIANDVSKYFAILPAIFVATYPELGALNVMRLHSPQSAILSAVIFNALVIVALVPLALRGVKFQPIGAAALLRRNLLVYGLGGLVAPFVGIKLIDVILTLLGFA